MGKARIVITLYKYSINELERLGKEDFFQNRRPAIQ
jgi:hypothetical protein